MAGLGIVGGLEAHGLTDQVVTTTVGTALVLVGLAMVLVALPSTAHAQLSHWLTRGAVMALAVVVICGSALAVLPAGRALALLDLGGLQLNRATLSLAPQAPERATALAEAEGTLSQALQSAPGQPALLRDLARVRAARYDDAGALAALREATQSPRLDAFDTLQIAHVYRDLGAAAEAYAWAARAYAAWGRPPEDAVMQVYAQNTLLDDEGGHWPRTLASQAEAAMRARAYGEALTLFQQAHTFAPDNFYLQDRVGAAERAVAKYGPGEPRQVD